MNGEPADPTPFPSFAALQSAHGDLVRSAREEEAGPAFFERTADFLRRGRATGALLDDAEERWAAQSLLDYWRTALYQGGEPPPEAVLADFDPQLAPQLPDAACPYRGLDPFREPDQRFFFGRRELVERLLARLREVPLLAVVGPSGSGKSSAVLAGLLPALKAGALPGSEGWRCLPPMVPGADPLASLQALLAAEGLTVPEGGEGDLPAGDAGWLARRLDAAGAPCLLVVDQCEEVFTLGGDEGAVERFLALLLAAVEGGRGHRLVLTLRADFEERLARFEALWEAWSRGRVEVPALTTGELREAIEAPAALAGLKFEAGVVEALLGELVGEPAALPLLQFSLSKLWEQRQRNRVTWEAYRHLGGGREALARSAEEIYTDLIPEERETARRILLELAQLSGGFEVTSRRVRRAALYAGGEARDRIDRVLAKLHRAHLVRETVGPAGADAQVELAHEALVRNWKRLADWLGEAREARRRRLLLTDLARQWEESGKDPDRLLRGRQLDEALEHRDLAGPEALFVEASEAARQRAEREREAAHRRKVRARRLVTVTVLVLLLAACFGLFQALREERRARRLAAARLLAEDAQVVEGTAGLLLAVEAARLGAQAGPPRFPPAEEAMRSLLAGFGGVVVEGLDGPAEEVIVSADGRWLLTPGSDGELALREFSAAGLSRPPRALGRNGDRPRLAAVSPDDRWLATAGEKPEVALWDLAEEEARPRRLPLADDTDGVGSLAFSADGRWLVAGGRDAVPLLWPRPAAGLQRPMERLGCEGSRARQWAKSGDLARIAVACSDGTVRLHDLPAEGPLQPARQLTGLVAPITALALSPGGRWLATGGAGGEVALRDLAAPEAAEALLPGRGAEVTKLAFDGEERWLAAAAAKGGLALWDLQARPPAGQALREAGDELAELLFSPDGRWLLALTKPGASLLWDLGGDGPRQLRLAAAVDPARRGVFSPDSRWLALGGRRGSLGLWDLEAEAAFVPGADHSLFAHQGDLAGLWVSPDGAWLLSKAEGEPPRRWSLAAAEPGDGVEPALLRQASGPVTALAVSPDGRRILAGGGGALAKLWDLEAEPLPRLMTALPSHRGGVAAAAYSPSGARAATADRAGAVRVWDLPPGLAGGRPERPVLETGADGSPVLALHLGEDRLRVIARRGVAEAALPLEEGPGKAAAGAGRAGGSWPSAGSLEAPAAWSPGGRWAVAGGEGGSPYLWELGGGETPFERRLRSHEGGLSAAAFSPAGGLLATGDAGGQVRVWDLQREQRLGEPIGSGEISGAITALAFGPRGEPLIAGSSDGTVALWPKPAGGSGELPALLLRRHRGAIRALAVSADGRWLASAAEGEAPRLWDLQAEVVAASSVPLPGHQGTVTAAAFDPRGRWLLTAGWDGAARRWSLDLRRLRELACQNAGRGLSAAEWEEHLRGEPYRPSCSGLLR